jgi:hypothetical protein
MAFASALPGPLVLVDEHNVSRFKRAAKVLPAQLGSFGCSSAGGGSIIHNQVPPSNNSFVSLH